MKKIYYKLVYKLISPLALSNGIGTKTDSDVILNSFGKPFIPATAIAGCLREKCDNAIELFGNIKEDDLQSSYIITYDANIQNKFNITVRDGVGLDEDKTVIKGAKFDFEVVEPNINFETYLEMGGSNYNSDTQKKVEELIKKIKILKVGGKTTRGYGKLELVELYYKEFDLTTISGINTWLDFDIINNSFGNNIINSITFENNNAYKFELKLKISGSPIIRKYSTNVSYDKDKPEPDYEQITIKNNDKNIPVIPGTSWAGAFRSRMLSFSKSLELINEQEGDNNLIQQAFGYVNNEKAKKSQITFSESQIKGSNPKIATRTAIDRFSGGSVGGSLYTERIYYGGTTDLIIEYDCKNEIQSKWISQLIICTIIDLDSGLLSVGGQTAVGHGLFEVMSMKFNNIDVTEKLKKYDIMSILEVAKNE